MHIMHVNISIKPECVDAFIEATKANASASINEPDITRFDFLQDLDDPTKFRLVEVYRTLEDVAKHKETAHFAKWFAAVENMMAEPRTRVFFRNCYPPDEGWE